MHCWVTFFFSFPFSSFHSFHSTSPFPYQVGDANDTSIGKKLPKEIPRARLKIDGELGQGQFGMVYKAIYTDDKGDKIDCAVKELKNADPGEQQELLKEATIMAQFEHKNVATIIGCVTRGAPVWVVMPLIQGGALNSLLKKRMDLVDELKADPFTVAEKMKMCFDISSGMAYLAALHFVHRDLAARNVLVDIPADVKKVKERNCIVSDFGMARDTEEQE